MASAITSLLIRKRLKPFIPMICVLLRWSV